MKRVATLLGVAALSLSASLSAQTDMLGDSLELQAPIRPGEAAVIPLDTLDPSFNTWRTLRDFSQDPAREPGPINVQKYELGMAWTGIPTFFRQPIALTPEDLRAGKVEVAIMGAYTDMSGGMRGAQHGPAAFRNSEVYGG
jgi:agmatinase